MSYTMAVWVGERPGSDAAAEREFLRLHARYFRGEGKHEVVPEIRAFLAAATARFPESGDLPDDEVDNCAWSDGPLIGNASGPLFHFGLCRYGVDHAREILVELARSHGLVGYDPQIGQAI